MSAPAGETADDGSGYRDGEWDLWGDLPNTDYEGFPKSTILRTHSAAICVPPCPLHSPTDHPLRDAPLLWRADRGVFERTCVHGLGHPDPDSVTFLRFVLDPVEFEARDPGDHGCDGCCNAA
jgi:hypothetical protein